MVTFSVLNLRLLLMIGLCSLIDQIQIPIKIIILLLALLGYLKKSTTLKIKYCDQSELVFLQTILLIFMLLLRPNPHTVRSPKHLEAVLIQK
jgi:uncharacterized membrane protein